MTFILQPKQREAFNLLCEQHYITTLYGGSRSGKSMLMLYNMILQADRIGERYLILRNERSKLKTSIWDQTLPDLLRKMGTSLSNPALKVDRTLLNINFKKSGGYIGLLGLRESSLDDILGTEWTLIWLNEVYDMSKELVLFLVSRLSTKGKTRARFWMDYNPGLNTHFTCDLRDNNRIDDIEFDHVALRMNPEDNKENLDSYYLQNLARLPPALRKRFLEGEFHQPQDTIFLPDQIRFGAIPDRFERVVIGIDPAVTANKNSDLTGIVIAGRNRLVNYVIDDLSGKYSPDSWCRIATEEYVRYKKVCRDVIISAEVNNGGDLVESVLRNVQRQHKVEVKYQACFATVDKRSRAENLSFRFSNEQWVFNEDKYSNLEPTVRQLISYNYEALKKSPDRVDALIIAADKLENHGKQFSLHMI